MAAPSVPLMGIVAPIKTKDAPAAPRTCFACESEAAEWASCRTTWMMSEPTEGRAYESMFSPICHKCIHNIRADDDAGCVLCDPTP